MMMSKDCFKPSNRFAKKSASTRGSIRALDIRLHNDTFEMHSSNRSAQSDESQQHRSSYETQQSIHSTQTARPVPSSYEDHDDHHGSRPNSIPARYSSMEMCHPLEHPAKKERGGSHGTLSRFTTASTTILHLRNGSNISPLREGHKEQSQQQPPRPPSPFKKPLRFWLIFISLLAVTCLTAIDMTIISTTLATIVHELPATSISGTWVTSSFLLAQTAFQPMMGGLADVSGRRNALVLAVLLFMAGSTIAALAKTMLVLVVGRGIQGVGGGGVQAITEIVLSDLTTLRERGIFVGFISLIFAVATFIAPLLGGYFSEHNWRWIFWINLPIAAIALCLIVPSMKLNLPVMPLKDKLQRMDIPANIVLLGSVVAILVAVTDGGIRHPWSAWQIYIPFTLGCAGLLFFFAIELTDNKFAPNPVLPRRLFTNRTAGSCFALTFLHGIATYGLIYIIPLYFQSVRGSSPLRSAIELFPATAPGPLAAILAGIFMVITGTYRKQMIFWWAVFTVGCGLPILLNSSTPAWKWVIYQLVPGFGVGAMFTLTLPPIQASLPVNELAHATATYAFCRSFGSVWGIAIGTNVFISVVNSRLAKIPRLQEYGLTGATALGSVERLGALPQELIQPAREAFMSALRWAFVAFVPVAGLGFLISFMVKDLPLPDLNESKHGLATGKDGCANSSEAYLMSQFGSQASFGNLAASSQDTLARLGTEEALLGMPHPPPRSLQATGSGYWSQSSLSQRPFP